ncbi:MAG: hypothetical protein IPP22_09485 [Nitrosomonas sp.]|nr:hypothetical protein [Nitrosomonas sp.]
MSIVLGAIIEFIGWQDWHYEYYASNSVTSTREIGIPLAIGANQRTNSYAVSLEARKICHGWFD